MDSVHDVSGDYLNDAADLQRALVARVNRQHQTAPKRVTS